MIVRRHAKTETAMNLKKSLCILILLFGAAVGAKGQNVSIKTNLLADAALSPNLGVDVQLAPQWSFDLSGQYNNWKVHEMRWKHWFVQPEARYWFNHALTKHFIGLHLIGGQFNLGNIKNNLTILGANFSGLSDYRYQGWAAGVGVAYGYAFPLARHWNLELEVGVGYAYMAYDRFACVKCGNVAENNSRHYVGPTKAALNLVYVF